MSLTEKPPTEPNVTQLFAHILDYTETQNELLRKLIDRLDSIVPRRDQSQLSEAVRVHLSR